MSSERVEQPGTPPMQGVPGRTLAAQREAMGWSVEQVADQLKLAVRQVVALEAGDYASLPSPAVTRGFVRAYAKILKLDPVPLVSMIEMDTPAPAEGAGTLRRDRPASFSEVRFPSHGKRAALPLGWIAGAVLVIAAGVAAWKFGLMPSSVPGSAAPAGAEHATVLVPPTSAGAPAVGSLQNPSVPLISVPPPAAAEGSATTSAGTPAGVAPAVAGVGAAVTGAPAGVAAAAPAAPAGGNALVLNVRDDSWIEVRAGKKKLIGRMVKAGSTETIEVTEPVTVVVGKPDSVSATLRGAAVELPEVPGKTFSRVTLK
jgi:cytoskeleton protein RodZ